jgi:hypothetical protein
VSSVASRANSTDKSSATPNSELRDELVRAVMPELRVLMQHLVNAAVERSIAPLLDKQRELEASFADLRSAQLRSLTSASTPTKHAPELASVARTVQVEANALVTAAVQTVSRNGVAPVPAAAVERPTVRARTEVIAAAAYDSNAMADIPRELNGSRRKKAVALAFAISAAILLLSVIGLSVLSNMGTYF